MTEQEKLAVTARAAERLRQYSAPVRFDLDITLTVALIGQLQLAFRHPSNNGPTRQTLEQFVRELIARIDPSGGDVYRFLMMGFDERYDA